MRESGHAYVRSSGLRERPAVRSSGRPVVGMAMIHVAVSKNGPKQQFDTQVLKRGANSRDDQTTGRPDDRTRL